MTGVLIKGQNLDTDRHIERMPWEDEGRDLLAKEYQRLPANHQKLGRTHGTHSLL